MNSTPIQASSLHPRSIFCVGKNYPDHALEMASWETDEATAAVLMAQEEPIIFMKPGTALSRDCRAAIPSFQGTPAGRNLHYEAELVLLVGRDATETSLEEAPHCIAGFGAGLDMTLRDVQLEAKKAGNPWLKSKGFRSSALVSDFISPESAGAWSTLFVALKRNGQQVQFSPVSKMTFSAIWLVHYLSYIYGLQQGDLIFTGTPAGVGQVFPGDRLEASLLRSENGDLRTLQTLVSLEATVS